MLLCLVSAENFSLGCMLLKACRIICRFVCEESYVIKMSSTYRKYPLIL
jgi:hypothetical protein